MAFYSSAISSLKFVKFEFESANLFLAPWFATDVFVFNSVVICHIKYECRLLIGAFHVSTATCRSVTANYIPFSELVS